MYVLYRILKPKPDGKVSLRYAAREDDFLASPYPGLSY
jgi:hypothetical protein